MSDSSNKRIAKNSLMLYFRVLFLLFINLYTSRVILQALGVEDYGIYNAVAGFITMFSMISGSMAGAISRFITYILGLGDIDKLKRVFNTSFFILLIISLVIVLLVEMIGVWFLNNHMTIPTERIVAANWVLQFSLATFVINLLSTPYNAELIAHERMTAFAYIGLIEGSAILGVAFLVKYSPIDSLIYYSALMCIVAISIRMIYSTYCSKIFPECKLCWIFDKKLFHEMFSFAGWNFIGFGSGLLREHGINLLFNLYFGPVVNAARGLASQVNTALTKFSESFYTAVLPQITIKYAEKDIDGSHRIVIWSSRFAFFLLLIIALPILFETRYILYLWLGNIPEHTIAFVRIITLFFLLESFSKPLIILMLATGDIKKYQIYVGTLNMLNFPFAWLLLELGFSSEIAQSSILLFSVIALFLRMMMLNKITNFPISYFTRNCLVRSLNVFALCCILPSYICLVYQESILRFVVSTVIGILVSIIIIATIGLDKQERNFIHNFILKKIIHK